MGTATQAFVGEPSPTRLKRYGTQLVEAIEGRRQLNVRMHQTEKLERVIEGQFSGIREYFEDRGYKFFEGVITPYEPGSDPRQHLMESRAEKGEVCILINVWATPANLALRRTDEGLMNGPSYELEITFLDHPGEGVEAGA